MNTFNEVRFKLRVEEAMRQVKTVLDNEKSPHLAEDVPHEYQDKYLLAEFLTNTAIAAHVNVLDILGLTSEKLTQLKAWSKTRSVTLQLDVTETCEFIKMEEKKASNKS